MKNPMLVVSGIVVGLLGLLFALQGLGYVKGSTMTDSNFWAVAGSVMVVLGVAMLVAGFRRPRSPETPL